MSNEHIFILFVFMPSLVLSLLMARTQRKFLKSYREIVNPDKPISTEEALKLLVQKIHSPKEFIDYLKGDFNRYPAVIMKLYSSHYKNPRLEKEANAVRKYTALTLVVPTIGFILFVLYVILYRALLAKLKFQWIARLEQNRRSVILPR